MLSVQSVDLFYGAAQALRQVSLEAKPGRVTCVLGRNGVGKTTLFSTIMGHTTMHGGSIRFNG
jgi:urea transport system ATP-binding protein